MAVTEVTREAAAGQVGDGTGVALEVQPGPPKPISFENSIASWRIAGEAHVARLPLSIAKRMRASALAALPRALIGVTADPSAGPGGSNG